MDYQECKITLPQEKVDLVSTFLVAGGFDTFEVCEYSDMLENAGKMFYDYIEDSLLQKQNEQPCIKFYAEKGSDEPEKIQNYLAGLCREQGWSDVSCTVTLVEGSDWDTKWKEYFTPFAVGEHLYIKPTWEEVPEGAFGDRQMIEMDPAAAFGSGTHATTKLCLEGLEKFVSSPVKVLDMGCGSGILGIGALKLGAREAVFVDIDEAAARTAEENLLQNGCKPETFRVFCGNVLEDGELREKIGRGFEVIAANIVAQVICEMAPILFDVLAPGGTLLASGILAIREEEVKNALIKAGFSYRKTLLSEEWVCMEFKK